LQKIKCSFAGKAEYPNQPYMKESILGQLVFKRNEIFATSDLKGLFGKTNAELRKQLHNRMKDENKEFVPSAANPLDIHDFLPMRIIPGAIPAVAAAADCCCCCWDSDDEEEEDEGDDLIDNDVLYTVIAGSQMTALLWLVALVTFVLYGFITRV